MFNYPIFIKVKKYFFIVFKAIKEYMYSYYTDKRILYFTIHWPVKRAIKNIFKYCLKEPFDKIDLFFADIAYYVRKFYRLFFRNGGDSYLMTQREKKTNKKSKKFVKHQIFLAEYRTMNWLFWAIMYITAFLLIATFLLIYLIKIILDGER